MNHDDSLRRQAAMQEALLTRQAERSLRAFVEQAWHVLEPTAPFVGNWHIDLICEHLEAITTGQTTKLLVNLPPRYMKSLLVSVLWPVWEWLAHPSRRWIFTSYSETLSLKHSLDRRTLVQSDWFQSRWGHIVQLALDQNLKGEFHNTARGVMVATSTGGSITGKGGNRIVIDDPHNPLQAESEAQRDTAISYFRQTLSTRLDDKRRDAIVVVMQRLHERDLSALCEDLGFETVRLPAEAEVQTTIVFPVSGRTLVRETGDVLWTAREGPPELAAQKRVLGSEAYAGQYQQRPVPAGGAIFQRAWFKFYDERPTELDDVTQSWDMAFKDGPDNDYVVGVVGGQVGADVYVMDRVKGQWSFSESCRQVEALRRKYPDSHTILIEDAANGTAIVNALTHRISGIIAVRPDGGKLARARAVQPMVEAGNVYLPNPRPHGRERPERAWVDDFLFQLTMFPRGAHDDDVDAFTQLLVRMQEPKLPNFVVW